jgi:hypothetical protein
LPAQVERLGDVLRQWIAPVAHQPIWPGMKQRMLAPRAL